MPTVYLTQTQIDKLRKYKAANGGNSKCKLRYRKTRSTPVRFCTGKADHYPVQVSHMSARALAKLMGHAPRKVVYRGRSHMCYTKTGQGRAPPPSPPPSPPPLSLGGEMPPPERPFRRRRSTVPLAALPNRGRSNFTETNPFLAHANTAEGGAISVVQENAQLRERYPDPELRDMMTEPQWALDLRTPDELRAFYTRLFELRSDTRHLDEETRRGMAERAVASELAQRT